MAVAYSGTNSSAKGTSATPTSGLLVVSGTNPVIVAAITLDTSGGNPTVNSVTFGGTGTPTLVKDVVNVGNVRTLVYCVPAPSGTGVVIFNLSLSTPYQLDVTLWTGADQTTPCPTGDAGSSTSPSTPLTVSASNVGASDGAYGVQGHTIAADCNGVTPNQIYSDSSTAVNMQDGYVIGNSTTGGVTFALTGGGNPQCATAVIRIVNASGSTNYTRSVTDAPASSESLARAFVGGRGIADAPSSTQSLTRTQNEPRQTVDAPTTTDLTSRVGVFARAITDAPHVTETLTRAQVLARSVIDVCSSTDSATKGSTLQRTITDAPTTSDTVTKQTSFSRAAADSRATSDTVGRTEVSVRSVIDSLATTDTVVESLVLVRSVVDALVTSDSSVRVETLARVTADALQTIDLVARTGVLVRSVVDVPTTFDVAAGVQTLARSAADVSTIAEAVARTFTGVRSTTDHPETSDIVLAADVSRSVVDVLTTVDSVTRTFVGTRTSTDSTAFTDTVVRSGIFTRGLTDSPSMTDVVSEILAQVRVSADSLTTSDAATRAQVLARTAQDDTSVTDVVVAVKSGSVTLVWADRVHQFSATVGTGPLVLSGRPINVRGFSEVMETGEACYGFAASQTTDGMWEVNLFTMLSDGSLERTQVLDSPTGGLTSFDGSVLDVVLDVPAKVIFQTMVTPGFSPVLR